MYQLTVGQFKAKFSAVLAKVVAGEVVGITYGKNKKKIAALVPYTHLKKATFKLGLLEKKASYTIHPGFTMTDEAFLQA